MPTTPQGWYDAFSDYEGSSWEAKLLDERLTPGETFGLEEMENVVDGFRAFFASRMLQYWERTGQPPSALTLSVDVTVDDERLAAVGPTVPDGGHRRAAGQ